MKKIVFIFLIFPFSSSFAQLFIGTANNTMSALSIRPMLDCNPPLNAVSFIFASAPGGNPAKLYSNFSNDGGDNWQSAGGNTLLDNLSPTNAPQYPCMFIYNDTSNTVADSSFLHWYSPVGNAGVYPGFRYGSTHPSNMPSATVSTSALPASVIASDGTITQQGEVFLVFPPLASGSLTAADTLYYLHGTWSSAIHNMVYSQGKITLPLSNSATNVFRYHHAGVAFANDGLTGYIYLLAHYDFSVANDSSYFPLVYKTTDGGLSWGTPKAVSLDSCNALLMTSPTLKYSAADEADATVDANGNLHIVTAVAPLLANNKLNTDGGQWGLFDIYTTDGGNTWYGELIDKPQTFTASFGGGLSAFCRAQASRTWSGDHLFFGWFDTDTITFGTTQNLHPNVFVKAYDLNSNQWTMTENKSAGAPYQDLAMFGMIAPYVLEAGTNYELPVAVAMASPGPNATADYRYLNDLYIDSTGFTLPSNPVLLTSGTVGVIKNDHSINIRLYPNPVNENLTLELPLPAADKMELSIENLLGQNITHAVINKGERLIHLNCKNLQRGIYLIKGNSTHEKIAVRFIKN